MVVTATIDATVVDKKLNNAIVLFVAGEDKKSIIDDELKIKFL
jgi:hypothetical protein